jgi:hypothetical protein
MKIATIAALIILTTARNSEAQTKPFQSLISGGVQSLVALNQKPAKAGDKFDAINIKAEGVLNIGTVNFIFNQRKLPAAQAVFVGGDRSRRDLNVPLLLKGSAFLNRNARGSRRVSAALSLIKGEVRIQFLASDFARSAKAPRLYSMSWKANEQAPIVARVSTKQNGQLLNKLCDSHKYEMGKTLSALAVSAPTKAVTSARVVTLSTDADPEWYAVYGESSNATIAAIVNAAEAIFEKQLGVRFALVRQHVYIGTSPYVSSDASELLRSFAKNLENPANLGLSPLTFDEDVDVKHLFTGKELTGNVIGLSYVGALCWSSKNAYGLSQNTTQDLNITTFMHEIGHTFGAAHDTTDVGSIMYPNLGIKRYFSTTSVTQINGFLATNGKCVAEQLVGANLTNATLTLESKRSKDRRTLVLKGNLLSNLASPLPGEMIKITLNKKVVFAMTDAAGAFVYRVRLSTLKVKKLSVFAQTLNSETAVAKPLKVPVRA